MGCFLAFESNLLFSLLSDEPILVCLSANDLKVCSGRKTKSVCWIERMEGFNMP